MDWQQIALDGLRGSSRDDLITLCRKSLCESDHTDIPCTMHPLGFYHVALYKHETVTIRLHYWPERPAFSGKAVTQYHDHVWHLQSYILIGSLTNVVLEAVADVDGAYVEADIVQVDGIDCVVPRNARIGLKPIEEVEYRAGEQYELAPGILHYTRIPEATKVITLVHAEVKRSGGPVTLVPFGYSGQAPARVRIDGTHRDRVFAEINRVMTN